MPQLMVIKGIDEGRQFELHGPVLGVGRDSSNFVHLHDTEISRRHAEFRLTLDGSGYRLHDRGSSNGVFVNGIPVKDTLLHSGDRIQIGQTTLVYSLGREERPADISGRVRMVARPDAELTDQIVSTIADAEGSRILSRPDEAQSPWLRTRLANLAILYEASQAVSHIVDVDQLLDRILELTFRSIEADRGCVLLINADTKRLEPKAARWRDDSSGHDSMTVSRTITDHVLRERQGILVSDAAQDARFSPGKSIYKVGIREAICVPLKGRHESIGVLYLDTVTKFARSPEPPAPKFTEDHLALAIALAHQAALAIEGSRYYQAMVQAERLAAIGQTIAALSHHIKNILHGLRSGSDILKMGIDGTDEELLRQGWKLVEKNQSRIYSLVLDMLSYSKEREPATEPTDLNALAGEVVGLLQARANELNAQLSTELDPSLPLVPADSEAIHRAVLNLVGNALDAVEGRPGAAVRVCTEREPDGQWVRIQVADNGVGIPTEQHEDIFKPFVSTKGARGTGLGLAVSRKTVREHGGDIVVQSSPDAGSSFSIRLPVRSSRISDTLLFSEIPEAN